MRDGLKIKLPQVTPALAFCSSDKLIAREIEAVKAGFPDFVKKTATEDKVLFYEFTVNANEIFCRGLHRR